ncbi:PAS domain S-box-containing protein [Enhydrobacter aerosaccus]|uniref:PAS domain S-box-containing protein n=1 Tax=Enhydrobacter aerosaccus TaxID=225324 RepID=A0A1T4SRL1_9HYPH|nr:PAS domain S-box protein [Enhydrobacter aerosaccus]SKA30792.1 PAS domain S-box-containing protein [Enhydrobacter aerosaccus]
MIATKIRALASRISFWFYALAVTLFLMLGVYTFRAAETLTSVDTFLWALPSGATGLIFALYGLHVVYSRSRLQGDPDAVDRIRLRRQSRLVLLAFLAFAGSAISVGGLYLREITETIRDQRFAQASTIAGLKAQQVEKWLFERSVEAETAAASIASLQGQASDSDRAQMTELLFAEWRARNPERRSAWLLAPDRRVLAFAGRAPEPEEIEPTLAAVRESGGAMRIVEMPGRNPATLRLAFIVPILDPATKQMRAVLSVRVDPALTLFKQLDETSSASPGEAVMLVRREGDDAVLVKAPPEAPVKAGQHISLKDKDRPAVQAVLQGNGVREGVDTIGTPVFSASHAIEGLPWFVVVRAPRAELSEPAWQSMSSMGLHIAGSVVVAGLMLFVLWATQRADMASLKARHLEERAAIAKHFEQMVQGARDSVILADPAGRIVEVNPAAMAAYGYSPEEIRKLTVRDLRADAARKDLEAQWKLSDSVKGAVYETTHQRKDGSTFPVEVSNNAVVVNDRTYRQAYVRDITQRKALETELHRIARVQEALQAANSLLLRAKTEDDLYSGMCDAIVKIGGYRMAIVVMANDDVAQTTRVAAFVGPYGGPMQRRDVTWGSGEGSEGVVGTAIRTGRVQVNQNIAVNTRVARWREEMLGEGVQSYIGLPLHVDGRVIGALTIYSEMPYAFDAAELRFLTQLADDVSYGVSALRAHKVSSAALP